MNNVGRIEKKKNLEDKHIVRVGVNFAMYFGTEESDKKEPTLQNVFENFHRGDEDSREHPRDKKITAQVDLPSEGGSINFNKAHYGEAETRPHANRRFFPVNRLSRHILSRVDIARRRKMSYGRRKRPTSLVDIPAYIWRR